MIEKVASEVIGVAIITTPAHHIETNQHTTGTMRQVGGPVTGGIQLGDDTGFRQVSCHSFGYSLRTRDIEAVGRDIVEA